MFPGIAVGGGGAFTVGEKLLGPPPSEPFSVGAGGGGTLLLAGVVVVVVVVVLVVGAGFSLELQAVVMPSMPTVTATAATADRWRSLFM
ncbi:MAG: hypothetical protein HY239_08375 [Mycolicibacterium aromaticivorans]|nr:hypothetical protein [Mycolicibacterium aromaticivorans]